jgi:hypothetical protein
MAERRRRPVQSTHQGARLATTTEEPQQVIGNTIGLQVHGLIFS